MVRTMVMWAVVAALACGLCKGCKASNNVVIVGDSICLNTYANSWPDRMAASINGANPGIISLHNLALPGSEVNQWRAREDQIRAAYVPSADRNICIVAIGVNDVLPYGLGGDFADLVGALVSDIHAMGYKVLVCTLIAANGMSPAERGHFNTNVRQYHSNWPAVGVIDFGIDAGMGAEGSSFRSDLFVDGLHPNNAGYALMAPYAIAAVNAVLNDGTVAPPPPPGFRIHAGAGPSGPFEPDSDHANGDQYYWPDPQQVDLSGVPSYFTATALRSIRYGQSFIYNPPGFEQNTNYNIRLGFMEGDAVNPRKMDVFINGVQVLHDFEVLAAAGGHVYKGVARTFQNISPQNGSMVIEFRGTQGDAIVSTIEVTPVSLDTGTTPPSGGDIVAPINTRGMFSSALNWLEEQCWHVVLGFLGFLAFALVIVAARVAILKVLRGGAV